ncbi:MAG: NAD-dependent epimerase/dehydratase family protein [bacterium]
MTQSILVTGAAGFIGFHLAKQLLEQGEKVVGIDNLNDYYDVNLKLARLDILNSFDGFSFHQIHLADTQDVSDLFKSQPFKQVIHLAAQAGVRYSIEAPERYVNSNLLGFANILEGCRHNPVEHLVYASSSSVYGANTKVPFSVDDSVDHPVSLYAATKKANELMAHSYAHLYGMAVTGVRFFTVYGPWGRPDMAYFGFAEKIMADQVIQVFNHGKMSRDFTYIDDVVDALQAIRIKPPEPLNNEEFSTNARYRVINVGHNKPETLEDFIRTLEKHLGKKAIKKYLPMQPGDVEHTFANIDPLIQEFGCQPKVSLDDGIARFCQWYKEWNAQD